MKDFLDKYCYIHLRVGWKDFYYLKAYVKEITDLHITFLDAERNKIYTYRVEDIVEIKLSNKVGEDGELKGS